MCGLVGIVAKHDVAPDIYDALTVLQHRGQDAAGIMTFSGGRFNQRKSEGLSFLDRILGTVFGFARGVILILVMVFVMRQLAPPEDLQWLQESRLMPHLDMLAEWTRTVFAGIGRQTGTTT